MIVKVERSNLNRKTKSEDSIAAENEKFLLFLIEQSLVFSEQSSELFGSVEPESANIRSKVDELSIDNAKEEQASFDNLQPSSFDNLQEVSNFKAEEEPVEAKRSEQKVFESKNVLDKRKKK